MHGDPLTKALYHETQTHLRWYRKAWRWLLWSPAIASAATVIEPLSGVSPWLIALPAFLIPVGVIRYWERRLYGLLCPSCDTGYVATFGDWICGHCYTKHTHAVYPTRRTFLEPCKKCNYLPHSVICPDCREPIIFNDPEFTKSPNHSAWHPDYPPITKYMGEKRPPKHVTKHLR